MAGTEHLCIQIFFKHGRNLWPKKTPWVIKCPHFSHHPTMIGINGLFYGYYFRWCPIFPKWDIYQPLNNVKQPIFLSYFPSSTMLTEQKPICFPFICHKHDPWFRMKYHHYVSIFQGWSPTGFSLESLKNDQNITSAGNQTWGGHWEIPYVHGHLSNYLAIYLSIHPSIYPSIHLSICLSVQINTRYIPVYIYGEPLVVFSDKHRRNRLRKFNSVPSLFQVSFHKWRSPRWHWYP